MRLFWLSAALLMAGCANLDKHVADAAAVADAGTTVAAATVPHVVEANPLGYATIPLKAYTLHAAQRMEPEDCKDTLKIYGTQWGALAGWGWGLIAGVGMGPAGAAALALGGLSYYLLDTGGAEKRCRNARPRTDKEWERVLERTEESQALWMNF